MEIVHGFKAKGRTILVATEEVPVGKIFGHGGYSWKVLEAIPVEQNGQNLFGLVVKRQPTFLERLEATKIEVMEQVCIDMLEEEKKEQAPPQQPMDFDGC